MLLKGGISDNNFFDSSGIAGNIAGAALGIASSLGGSVASGSNKLEHLFTIPNEESSYNSFMPDIEAAIQSSIDEVLQGLDDMAAQAEWDDLLRHPTRATRSITDTYYRMKNSQIAERQARQQSGGAGYKNIILKNPVDPQRYREIVKSALENRAEVRWNNRINADVRHYKLENLDLAHPVVSWLRDNTSDNNSEILRMYSVDALKRLALPDERRTEIDAHYFNEDVEVVKALNNIEAYAKEAQQQIEANMAELKEMLTRQQALNTPPPSPMDTPSLADLLKIEKLGKFDIGLKLSKLYREAKQYKPQKPKYTKAVLKAREEKIKGNLPDMTDIFDKVVLKRLNEIKNYEEAKMFIEKAINEENHDYLYHGKVISGDVLSYIAKGYSYKKIYNKPLPLTEKQSEIHYEATVAGQRLAIGKAPFGKLAPQKYINKYHKYAPIRLLNADVVTSTGKTIPSRYIQTIHWFEYAEWKRKADKVDAINNNLHDLRNDESMEEFNIKPSTIAKMNQIFGYFKHLEGETRKTNINYIDYNPYQATGEILGAYIDRWMPCLYAENNGKYSEEDIDKNFALIAQLYHQGEKDTGPTSEPKIEPWGYGMISHNHMYYHFKKMKPEYGKFKVLGENPDPYQKETEESNWWSKTFYFGNTALKNTIK